MNFRFPESVFETVVCRIWAAPGGARILQTGIVRYALSAAERAAALSGRKFFCGGKV